MPPTRKLPVSLTLVGDDAKADGKTKRDWKAASSIAMELMLRADLAGVWTMRAINKMRQMSKRRFKLVHLKNHSLIVRIKPGDNDSVWEYALNPPGGTNVHQAQQALYDASEAEPDAVNGHEPELSEHIRVTELPCDPVVDAITTIAKEHTAGCGAFDVLGMLNRLQAGATRHKTRHDEMERIEARKAELQAQIDELRKEITKLDEAWLSIGKEDDADEESTQAMEALDKLEGLLAARRAEQTPEPPQ